MCLRILYVNIVSLILSVRLLWVMAVMIFGEETCLNSSFIYVVMQKFLLFNLREYYFVNNFYSILYCNIYHNILDLQP